MRLFSALLPPADIVESLRAELDRLGAGHGDEIRWVDSGDWHVTLGYYGEQEDPSGHVHLLAERLAGHEAPRLRLDGAGTFPGVLVLNVGGDGLDEVAAAAGAGSEGREYRPHLTLGRWPRERPEVAEPWLRRLAGYRTELWTARAAVLMRSDRGPDGVRYRMIETFPLG
jgi:2'-5' RNA ligase